MGRVVHEHSMHVLGGDKKGQLFSPGRIMLSWRVEG